MLRYRNRLSKFETLESRRLLASDIAFEMASRESSPISQLTLDAVAEGEAQANLVQFAKDLTTSGTVFFGAGWCPACTVQKDLFEDGGDDLPFVEVTNPDRSLNQIGAENNIELFPTWVFPDGSRLTGVLTLSELSEAAGVPIPTGESPSFTEIGGQTVLIGSPQHIPVDAYDPNGEPLTVTVSVEDESLLEAVVIEGNRSIRIDMDGYGDMVFELFEQRAPRASGRVIELAEADFYDDVIFHRIIDDFVIQGGDPTGTGSGGSPLGDFDDDFHPDLQHNRPGILSYAKAGDDTNDSQFFITEVPTRFLDFQHSVFGVLVEGEDVREAISEHAVNATDRPTVEISINAIDVFEDSENSVFMLKPTGNGVGSTNVTVVVTDSSGNSSTETFQVDVGVDTFNTQPFLNEMDLDPLYPIGEPVSVQLSRTDVEGDPANFFAELLGNTPNVGLALSETAVLTVTPPPDFQGVLRVRTFTQEIGRGGSDFDTQILEFEFGEPIVQLAGESDSGVEGDSITNATNLTFDLFGLAENTTGELLIDGVVAETWSSSEPSFSVTTDAFASLADGSYDVSARINSGGQTVITAISVVTLDRTVPEFDLSNVPAAIALGSAASWEVLYVGDDSGPNGTEVDAVNQVAASLDNGPTGMRIANHELLWTPVPQQLGRHTYRLTATDRAGNQVTSSFSIEVTPDPNVTPLVEIALVVVDGDGMEVDQLEVGEPFQLVIIAKDLRTGADLDGIRAVYADVLFEGAIETRGAGPIQYGDDFTVDQKGSIEASGIDELGAALEGNSPTFLDSVVVATVDLVATSLGSVTIRTEPAEGFTSEVQLVGIDEAVSPSQVTYSQLDLQINASMHRLELPTDVNGRDGVTPLDALLIINLLSRRGANLNVYELDLSEFDPDLQYDVNGSGDISPLDALGVINAIARSASGESSGEGERARLVDRTFETNWDNEDELHGWVSSHRLF